MTLGGARSEPTGRSNYPYVTARVRALKNDLLPREEYPKLIARDVHGIARRLEEGRYGDEINDLSSEYRGAQLIEQATQRQLGDEFETILGWCRGEPRTLLGLYFERFVVANLKTILRGVSAGADPDEVRAGLLPAGFVQRGAWEAALDTDSREACVQALPRTRYTGIVEDLVEAPVREVENALDRAYYEELLDAVDPRNQANEAFLDFLRREIDVVNLKFLARCKHAGTDPERLVEGGKAVRGNLADRLRVAGWEELPNLLEETTFGDELRPSLETYLETRDLNRLTSDLEHLHLEEADQFGYRYPLSILPLVDYVLRKRLEVERLRMIAFGKQTGLSNDEIEDLIDL
jgi:V/A-type H+-transporting ATPase subunit C